MASPNKPELVDPSSDDDADGLIEVNPDTTSGALEKRDTFSSLQHQRAGLHNKQLSQDIRERKRYAVAAFRLTRTWVGFLIAATLLQFGLSIIGAGLTEAMFIALVTTTTVSVLGVWALVGGYLFGFPGRKVKRMLDKEEPED